MATLREMAGASAGGDPNPGANGGDVGGDAGGDSDEPPPGQRLDPKYLHGQNKMLQRLLKKQQDELTTLREGMSGMDDVKKKVGALGALFGAPEPKQADGEKPIGISERARRVHQRMIDQDPDSPGMPLTVDTASTAEEAFTLVKQQADVIAKLQEQIKKVSSPMHAAEGSFFVNLEDGIRDELVTLFEDQAIADQNYPDFERIAIEEMNKLHADPVKWRRLITSQKVRSEFIRDVIQRKLPRSYVKRGSQPIPEDYTDDMAKADQRKAESMKNHAEAAALMKKARQQLLPGMLGIEFNKQRG